MKKIIFTLVFMVMTITNVMGDGITIKDIEECEQHPGVFRFSYIINDGDYKAVYENNGFYDIILSVDEPSSDKRLLLGVIRMNGTYFDFIMVYDEKTKYITWNTDGLMQVFGTYYEDCLRYYSDEFYFDREDGRKYVYLSYGYEEPQGYIPRETLYNGTYKLEIRCGNYTESGSIVIKQTASRSIVAKNSLNFGEGIEGVGSSDSGVKKVLDENGNVRIVSNGHTYDMLGREVK